MIFNMAKLNENINTVIVNKNIENSVISTCETFIPVLLTSDADSEICEKKNTKIGNKHANNILRFDDSMSRSVAKSSNPGSVYRYWFESSRILENFSISLYE